MQEPTNPITYEDKKYLLDTGVILGLLGGWPEAIQFVSSLTAEQITFSVINEAEILCGIKARKAFRKLDYLQKYFFKRHKVYNIDRNISNFASDIYLPLKQMGRISDKVTPDIYIAATCMYNDLTLITYNAKDFEYIKGLDLMVLKRLK